MNTKIYLFFFLLIGLTLSSCGKDDDVIEEEEPTIESLLEGTWYYSQVDNYSYYKDGTVDHQTSVIPNEDRAVYEVNINGTFSMTNSLGETHEGRWDLAENNTKVYFNFFTGVEPFEFEVIEELDENRFVRFGSRVIENHESLEKQERRVIMLR
ncbi:hypothetical protein ACE193_15970 [Bernardetia sp. OM2101]|uniref:hypothetical protein n=1 Tax=Bernardetia sp. OM2101 TaxID=3344876 RepID=UPI0035D0177F